MKNIPNITGKYILVDKEPVSCPNLEQWARWMEVGENRRVAITKIKNITISTVFLALDHNFQQFFNEDGKPGQVPILFETMIFGGHFNDACDRYSTFAAAESGHKYWVQKVKNSFKSY